MDEESKQLLTEIRDLQREQLKLLREATFAPWLRTQFSLRWLLAVMTVIAIGLGLMVFMKNLRSRSTPIPPAPQKLSLFGSIDVGRYDADF